ncbi:MAG: tetraacyldisaccharide 4'-kinase [Burkholderiaceae bacterium]
MSTRGVLAPALAAVWRRRGIAARALHPLSLLYGAVAASRRKRYLSGAAAVVRPPVPVIVVGNLYVGGTGKTPFVIWLVGMLREAGYVPGVISRGYGGAGDAPRSVTAASSARDAGDEPLLIVQRANCPVVVGRRRGEAALALLGAHPEVDVLVADDGLQHYALARDVEIVLFDGRGGGNGWLLPAGPLREPLSRPRDFTVVNGGGRPPGVPADAWTMQLVGDYAETLNDASRRVPLASLAGSGKRLAAAAGIGNPSRFFDMLRGAGLRFAEIPLPDHYDFRADPFAGVTADVILITEKDAVKCRQVAALRDDPRLWTVPVAARLDPALARNILEKLRGSPPA